MKTKLKAPYLTWRHAARAFARRYCEYLGGGWFSLGRRKLQGHHELWALLKSKGWALPWSDGRVEMHFELLDACLKPARPLEP